MSVNMLNAEIHPVTGQPFLMSYVPRNGSRDDPRTHKIKTMLRPRTYQDAVNAARTSFPDISADSNVVFESNEFQWYEYYRVIESDEWERPEVRNFLWKVLVTETVDTVDNFAVSDPTAQVKVYIANPADPRPSAATAKNQSLSCTVLTRSTTIENIKVQVGRAYRVQPTAFSLVRHAANSRFGIGTDYMGTYADKRCIGEICTDGEVYFAIVWHGDSY